MPNYPPIPLTKRFLVEDRDLFSSMDAGVFHVNDDYTPVAPPGSTLGHFECEGTAIHFTDGKQYE
jgi:hypothetical protein